VFEKSGDKNQAAPAFSILVMLETVADHGAQAANPKRDDFCV